MKTLLICVLSCCSTIVHAQHWVRYTDPDSTFSVDLPGRPTELSDTIYSQGDTIIIETYYTKVDNEQVSKNTAYNITSLTYQAAAADSITHYAKTIERTMINDIAAQLGGSVDYKAKDVTTGGSRGRILCKDKSTLCRIVTIADGRRILTLQVFTPVEESLNGDTAAFFESLALLR